MRQKMILTILSAGLVLAGCDSYTSTDAWPNPYPHPTTDNDTLTVYDGTITDIEQLNKNANVTLNSHASECASSSLEMNYRSYVTVESPALAAVNALYPRIKKLANGSYLMLYQQGSSAWNVYYAISSDLKTWTAAGTLFAQQNVTNDKGESDVRCFSSADALVLANGDILAFAAFRNNKGYYTEPQNNGIMMRRSTDNGKSWTSQQVIRVGSTWEPYGLQLSSGEIQVYYTDCEPNSGDSGTSLLRSTDNGKTWTTVGYVVRQKTTLANDGSGKQIFSDQMPVACELNKSHKVAVATEVRFGSGSNATYKISMAWDDGKWSYAPLTGTDEGPTERNKNFLNAAAPYLVQFASGETVLSCNASSIFEMRLGDTDAKNWGEAYQPFSGKGYWGAMEVINNHTLVATMPATFTNSSNVSAARIQIAKFVLNHRINATSMTPVVDGTNEGWSKVDDALFIGSNSQAQAVFRFAYDTNNLYCLVERSDNNLSAEDIIDLSFQSGDGTGSPFKVSVIPETSSNTMKYTPSTVVCQSSVAGIFGSSEEARGYIVELAIPRSLLRIVNDKILFNATLYDSLGSDTFTGLTSSNYDKWIPVVLAAEKEEEVVPGDGDNGSGPSWGNDNNEQSWK
jgi:hypothetical protein